MSTIVVVKKGDSTAIAADTLITFGETKLGSRYLAANDKIIKFKDNYIGIVGSTAHNNVLLSIVRKHPELISLKSREEIFDSYLKLHPLLKERYFLNPNEKDDEQDYESSQINALIANPYGIFGMYAWREVYEYDLFWAIGTGRDYALGAMYAVYDRLAAAEEIARIGVAAGCEFDGASSLPATVYTIDLLKPKPQKKPSKNKR